MFLTRVADHSQPRIKRMSAVSHARSESRRRSAHMPIDGAIKVDGWSEVKHATYPVTVYARVVCKCACRHVMKCSKFLFLQHGHALTLRSALAAAAAQVERIVPS